MSSIDFPGTERFEVKRRLGAGGMGVVYEAYDRERKSAVALKTLLRVDGQSLLRFKNEFRALHGIEHPNLISLHEFSEVDGECFFTMELVRGVDFLTYVRGQAAGSTNESDLTTRRVRGPRGSDTPHADFAVAPTSLPGAAEYDEVKLRAALAQLAQGVAALHAAGMVHRDIKPSNIIVTAAGRVVLLDFGLVTAAEKDGQSTEANLVGTAEYMAPEQAVSGELGPAADWYSVGVVLYEALTGRLPHKGRSSLETLMNKQQDPAVPPREWVADIPGDLDTLCEMLLRREPRDRPSASVVFDQLGLVDVDAPAPSRGSTSGTFTQTTPFVGRQQELALLSKAFQDSQASALAIVIEGESGVGKSELVRQFTRQLPLDVPDVVVLAGRCYERESMAYKALDGIVDELSHYMTHLPKVDAAALLPLRAGLLPRLFPVLQRVEAIAAAPRTTRIHDPQEMRRQMFGALRELLARLAMRSPVVLVIDDLQWTDTDSLALLHEILADAEAPNLLLLVTVRPMETATRERVFAALSALEQRQIDLAAFSVDHARELAALLLPSFDNDAHRVIANEAAGHPLFVMELARYVQGHSDRHGHGVTLDEALWQRISELPSNLFGLLEILCVAGVPITQQTAANAAQMTNAEFAKAASVLRIAYLVRTAGVRTHELIEPYHDRIREIVTGRLSSDARTNCHRRLALALEQSGAAKTAPQALVRHAAAAGDTERAAMHAEAAAAHAIEALAFDQAAEFFQTALHLGAHTDDKVRTLRIALAEALVNAGRGPEAAVTFMTAGQGAESAVRLECQRQAAEQWLISGHTERGLDAMVELLAQIGVKMPKTPRRALLSMLWVRARLRFGLRWKEKTESQIAPDQLTRIDIYKAVSHGLGLVDTIRGADFQARGLMLALRTGERLRVARAVFTESLFLASQGGRLVKRGRAMAHKAIQIDNDDPYLHAWLSTAEGCLCYFGGRFVAASEQLSKAESEFRAQAGASWELSTVRLFLSWSLLRRGAYSELVPLIDGYFRDAIRRGDNYVQTSLVRSCHRVWLVADDLDRARRVLEEASWQPPEGRYHLQHWFEFQASSEIHMYEGTVSSELAQTTGEWAAVKKALLLRIVPVRIDAYWLRGRLALAVDTSRASLKLVARMARLLEREKESYATASALLMRAAIAVQTGDRAGAVAILVTTVTAAEDTDLLIHAAAARRRHGELVGGDDGAALIAAADTWMVAQGIRNPTRMFAVIAPGFSSAT